MGGNVFRDQKSRLNPKKTNVYVLLLDYVGDTDSCVSVLGVYSTLVKAKEAFKKQLESEKEFGVEYDHLDMDTDTEYSAYMDGEYLTNHLELKIIRKELE